MGGGNTQRSLAWARSRWRTPFSSNVIVRQAQVAMFQRYQGQLVLKVSELEEMASRDELTGLHNRRYFYQAVQNDLGKALASKEPLALMLLDLDGLKLINDEFGTESVISCSPTSAKSSSSISRQRCRGPHWRRRVRRGHAAHRQARARSRWRDDSGKSWSRCRCTRKTGAASW